MNLDTIADLDYNDRVRVIKTLKITGIPIPINLILEHLKHKDRVFAITKEEFDFAFEGHSLETKKLWEPQIFAPIELSDSDESESEISDPTFSVEEESETELEDVDNPSLSKIPIKRKNPFYTQYLKIKIFKDKPREVLLEKT
jgi:hypothetical protein